jgi:hypothetical protein
MGGGAVGLGRSETRPGRDGPLVFLAAFTENGYVTSSSKPSFIGNHY